MHPCAQFYTIQDCAIFYASAVDIPKKTTLWYYRVNAHPEQLAVANFADTGGGVNFLMMNSVDTKIKINLILGPGEEVGTDHILRNDYQDESPKNNTIPPMHVRLPGPNGVRTERGAGARNCETRLRRDDGSALMYALRKKITHRKTNQASVQSGFVKILIFELWFLMSILLGHWFCSDFFEENSKFRALVISSFGFGRVGPQLCGETPKK